MDNLVFVLGLIILIGSAYLLRKKYHKGYLATGCLSSIIAFVSLVILVAIFVDTSKTEEQKEEVKTTSTVADETKSVAPKTTWQTATEKDEMRGSTNTWTYIISDNVVNFDFPYDGGSTLRIDVRHMKQYGTDVILTVSKGQFNGSELNGTNYVTIKFDGGSPKKYYFNTSNDGEANTIFLKKKSELIKKFKKSKDIMIEAPFYQAGNQVFKFHVDEPLK